jgi:hypothetical protein
MIGARRVARKADAADRLAAGVERKAAAERRRELESISLGKSF